MTISIGDIVYKRRIELGMTQKQLADKAEISSGTVSDLECGRYVPRYDTLMLVMDALELRIVFEEVEDE